MKLAALTQPHSPKNESKKETQLPIIPMSKVKIIKKRVTLPKVFTQPIGSAAKHDKLLLA